MKERFEPGHEESHDSFWNVDEVLGEGDFYGEQFLVRVKAHITREHYRLERREIVPLMAPAGTRIYVLAKPYILTPDISLTLGLYPAPTPEGAIGEIMASEWEGMRPIGVAHAQAGAYPQEKTLVLWECLMDDRFRSTDPRSDTTLRDVWTGFEAFLLRHMHGVDRIVTPGWEPTFWQNFLESLGYRRANDLAFEKEVEGS